VTKALLAETSPYIHISLESFLHIANIPENNELIKAHFIVNGINHWTYFERATEAQLTTLGSTIGTASLLCNTKATISPHIITERSTHNKGKNNPTTSKAQSSQSTLPKGPCTVMEGFLDTCHINGNNQVTRARFKIHGISNWTFFLKSSEDKLTKLGFPLGTSRLLCEGVCKM
jgi:hypothetical protein